jgi:hypothetical protein
VREREEQRESEREIEDRNIIYIVQKEIIKLIVYFVPAGF